MIEIVNIDKLSDDGFKQPANNPDLINPDNIKYAELRYNTFASNQAVRGVAVVGSSSTFAFDISSSIPYTLFKLYKSTDGITYNEDKSYGGEIGRVPSVAGSGGSGSGGEQSGNVVRLIPSGTYELGKVYREISDAITYCGTIADIDTRMTIQIEGDGVGGDVETDFNVLPATLGVGTLAKWISYSGLNKSMTLAVVAETATYTGELDDELNRVKITNLRINQTVQSITTTFENIDFSGCSFNADFPDGSFENYYEFVNCNFSDCYNLTASLVTFDSACSGVFDNTLLRGLIVGTDTPLTVVSGVGYVTPQRLLIKGTESIALTTGTLTLTNGNWYDVTGTGASGNGLYLISNSGWAEGSEVSLRFAEVMPLRHAQTSQAISLKNNIDRYTYANEIVTFKYNGSYWVEQYSSVFNNRLLGVADTSIANSTGGVTLTDGNVFTITGTGSGGNGLYTITTLGWTVNSIVTLTIATIQTLRQQPTSGANLSLIGGVNRSSTTNEVIRFKLNASNLWVEF